MAKNESERSEGTASRSKKKSSPGAGSLIGSMVASAAATEGLFELIERLGLIDMVVDRVKQRVEEIDLDEFLDEARDYLKRNPEVLVVSLGALTIAAGVIVYLNARREWDGTERRRMDEDDEPKQASASGRSRSAGHRKAS